MRKHIIRFLMVMLSVCLGMAILAGCTTETPTDKKYTVTYAAGGGTGTAPAVEEYKEGETFKVKANSFTYEGYTFTTWNDGEKDVKPGATYTMPAKNVTFTAKWEKKAEDLYSGYWKGSVEGEKIGVDGKTFDVLAAVMCDETDLFVGVVLTEKGGSAKLGTGLYATIAEDGKISTSGFSGVTGKLENDKLTLPVSEKDTIELTGRTALDADVSLDGVYSADEDTLFLDFDRGVADFGGGFEDVEFVAIGKYVVGFMEMAQGSETVTYGAFIAEKSGENFVVVNPGGESYTFAPFDGEIKEEYAYTSATLEATADKVYIVVSGTYSGYTAASFEAQLKDDNLNVLAPSVCLGEDPWTYQETTTEVEVNRDGTWTVKIDVTALDGTIPFFVCMNRSGSGDIKTLPEDVNVSEELGEKKYTIQKGHSSTLTLTVGKAGQKYAFTGMTLETAADKIYLVVSGTYSGYTDQEIKAAFEDEDLKNLALGINNSSNWQWPDCPTTVTAENGQFSVKLDITEVELGTFTICENRSGVGDIKWNEEFAGTVTFGDKKYTIERQWAGGSEVKIEAYVAVPEEATYEVTAFTIEKQGEKVYLLYKGTCANYDAATLEAALKALPLRFDIHKIGGDATGADGTGWTFAMGEGTWEMKIDITATEGGYFAVGGVYFIDNLNDYTDSGKYFNLWNQELTVELGGTTYKAGGPLTDPNTWTNVSFTIEGAPAEYTFSAPTSAKLELANDKGNGKDEAFNNDIERAFFVLSGTYTGEVTEAIAKDYFKQANYPFEFGRGDGVEMNIAAKDRIRRISIDTAAKTWTVKFDVTALVAGTYYCRFSSTSDLRLSLEQAPTGTVVKSIGKTFTFTNWANQGMDNAHFWECLTLKVEHNYAVTGVEVKEAEGKANLVVSGTFDDAFTAEQIKKFLEDEDIRSMCVDLYGSAWMKVATTVTAEAGKFSVSIDLTAVAAGNYSVCIDASGYGDIKMESLTGTLTSGGKTYTLSVDADKNVKLAIA